jgi:DNA-binding XRE family transcriptional regulator
MKSQGGLSRINFSDIDVRSRSARSRLGAVADPPARGVGPRHAQIAADPVTGSTERGRAMTPNRTFRHRVAREFGATLRAARRSCGLTQEEIADRADFDRTYPSLLERGLRTPTLTVLLKLAEALQIEPAKLIDGVVQRLRVNEGGVLSPST